LRLLFLAACVVAAALLLAQQWDKITASLIRADLGLIALALLAAMVNVAMTGLSWRALLTHAPVQLSPGASARIFFLGQIGKYLPGTVWSFLASGELASRVGFPRGAAMASLALALIIGVGSGVLVAVMLVPQAVGLFPQSPLIWIAGAALALLCLLPPVRRTLLRIARIDFPVPLSSLIASGALALLAWVFAGAQIVLLSQAIGASLGWSDLLQTTGAYAFAWIAGFLVFFAPAGLGAREGGLLAVLTVTMGLAEATIIVLLSRLVVTLADFACAGIAALIPAPSAARSAAAPPHPG
jgi:uncharacterized membrane protein YbhN (UPF0104 family)